MNNSLYVPGLLLLGLFSLGVLVGINVFDKNDDELIEVIEPASPPASAAYNDAIVSQSPDETSQTINSDTEHNASYVQSIEEKITDLEARIERLEQASSSSTNDKHKTEPSIFESRLNRMNNLQTTDSLLKAGISEAVATDIVRRRNEVELQKLELRDKASRENYINTSRYVRELNTLNEKQVSLRDELGDEAYDLYLYANGQANRVKVLSVMQGSAAEEAGIKDADVVVSYAQQRLFEWVELKNATSEGELGEYVTIDVLRSGQLMSLWVPRGPLGVRLGSARVAP